MGGLMRLRTLACVSCGEVRSSRKSKPMPLCRRCALREWHAAHPAKTTPSAMCHRCLQLREATRKIPTEYCQPCSVAVYNERRAEQAAPPSRKLLYHKEWYKKNKREADERCRNWRISERLRLISLMGGRCNSCGEADSDVLDFDHVEDDGHLERGGHTMFKVKENPFRFQLLCKNCNWRKELNRRRSAIEKMGAGR